MGEILFWIEAAATSAIFMALGMGLCSRIHRRGRQWLVKILWWSLALLPWLVAVGVFTAVEVRAGGALMPLIYSSLAGFAFLAATVIIVKRARRPSALDGGTAASSWRLDRLALSWVAAMLVTGMTLWNLDLAVCQEMATLKVEAGAMALSVSPPRIPESQNAAPLYRQAWEILDAQQNTAGKWGESVSEWLRPEKGQFDPDNKQMLEFLQKQGAVIDLLRKAGRMPGCDFGTNYNPPSVATVIPNLQYTRNLSRLLCLSSRVSAHNGRMNEAMMDMSAALALAEHCAVEPALIGSLVSFACEGNAFETFHYVLDQGELTKDSISVISLNPFLSFNAALHRSIRMETAFGISIFTDPSIVVADVENVTGSGGYIISSVAPFRVFLWKNDVTAYLKCMRRYESLSAEPYHSQIQERPKSQREKDNELGGLIANLITPALSRCGEQAAQADAQHRLIVLAVAMWQYRLAEGSFPDDLGRLVPKYIPTAPVDPFTGKSMKITKADGKFTIYSVGPDLRDDGGKPLDRKTRQGDISLTLK